MVTFFKGSFTAEKMMKFVLETFKAKQLAFNHILSSQLTMFLMYQGCPPRGICWCHQQKGKSLDYSIHWIGRLCIVEIEEDLVQILEVHHKQLA